MSFGAAACVAMPTTGAPTMGSPSAEGDVGTGAVIGAEVMAGADGITDGDEVAVADDVAGVEMFDGATAAGGGVAVAKSTGRGVGVPGTSMSRARGAVELRPIPAPHVAQKRCPGGFGALQAGQIVGPSALNDFENLNDGASGRCRTDAGLPEPGSPALDDGPMVDGLLVGSAGVELAGDGDASASSVTLSSDANSAAELGPFASMDSTRSRPRGGVGGTPRLCGFSRRPQSRQNVKWSAFSRLQTSQITGASGDLVGAIKSSIAHKIAGTSIVAAERAARCQRAGRYLRPISLRNSN
jgi:hypothetical protein